MPTNPIVEVAFDTSPLDPVPVWTDVTRYVHMLDNPITITHGTRDEFDQVQAGQLSLTLDNTDGRFTPGNPASPYYPYVLKGRRIRVRQVHVEANHLLNPSFETGSTLYWSAAGGAALVGVTTRAHHGGFSGQVTWAAGVDGVVSANLYGLEVGDTYEVSAWVWVPAGGSPPVRLGIQGGALGAASTTVDAWQEISLPFAATNTRHTVTLTPTAATTAGQQCWLDEIMVGEPGQPFGATPAIISPRYNGYLNRWPVEWPGGGQQAITSITATDVFKSLDREPLLSLLEQEILSDAPVAYYPLAEPAGSTSAGDLSGALGGPLAVKQVGGGGELSFGAGTGAGASGLACPTFAPVSATDGVYLVGDLGPDFDTATSDHFITVEFWFSTTTTGRTILALSSLDEFHELIFRVLADGRLQMYHTARTSTGSRASGSTITWDFAGPLANGAMHHVVWIEQTREGFLDGVRGVSSMAFPMFQLRRLSIGGYSGATTGTSMFAGQVAHAAVYASTLTNAQAVDHYHAGADGFFGEAADDRLRRIAGYAGVSLFTEGSLFDPIDSQGAGARSALGLMREVVVTESGRLFAARDDGLIYQSRDVRYNRSAGLTLDAADLEPPQWLDDDQYLINRVDASRPGGARIRIEDTTSQATYGGVYGRTLSLLKTSDAAMVDAAQWVVARYADPPPRLTELTVEGATLDTATYRALLALEISDLVTLINMPVQAPTDTETVVVEGWVERITPGQHWWTFAGSRGTADQVWQLNSIKFSQLGTSTRLAY